MMTKQLLKISAPLEKLTQPYQQQKINPKINPCPVTNNGANFKGW